MGKPIFPVEATKDDFSYPSGADFTVYQHDGYQIHEITYNGDPASGFEKAPNGSRIFRIDAGNVKLYIKNGTRGKIDGTLVAVALS